MAQEGGRRRYLTVLFSDLSDSTFLSGILEAEHYAQMLGELRRCFRDVVLKHGGHIARIQGDGVLAIFGFPQASEDDGRRATEAALELHAAAGRIVIEGNTGSAGSLMLHSGIHGGLVFLAEGDVERGRFELLGNVPNTAARLGGLAQRGEICVSETTLGAEAHFFATTGPQPIEVEGTARPLMVYRVVGHAPVNSRFEARAMRGLAPFVGRAQEIGVLEQRLQLAQAGQPQCVALAGGPGLGKTRLIEEFLRNRDVGGALVLRGYCESYLSAEPLQPFLQMLRSMFGLKPAMTGDEAETSARAAWSRLGIGDDDLREARRQAMALVGAVSGGSPAKAGQGGTIAALQAVFDVLARTRPLLVVVDDWQWADDASQETLAAIRSLQRPIFVLVALRRASSDPLAVTTDTTLELQPLALDDATRTMETLLPGADPFMVAEIHRYAGGNPLFIEELCHAASADGGSRRFERRTGGVWLNALIESRVARLPIEQAEVVKAAAVIGNAFPSWLLENLTGRAESDPLLHALADQDFLYPAEQPGTMRFKHAIARDVVYDAIGLHERRQMHLRVASALLGEGQSGSEDYEALAYHFAAGGVHADAAHYAELAGDKAMLASALDRARTQYVVALEALDALSPLSRERQLRWCAVAHKVGMVCVYDPLSLAEGVSLFERAVELARHSGDLETIARSEYWLGYTCYAKGRTRQAIVHLREALAVSARLDDTRLTAQIEATLGQSLTADCQYEPAHALLDGAIDVKRQQSKPGGHVAVGSAYTLSCKGYLLGDQGQFALAAECFDEALHLLGDSPHQVGCSVRGWISTVHQWQGRWDDALEVADEAAHLAQHVRSRHLLAMCRALGGYARFMRTGDAKGLETIRTSTAWIEARNGAFFTSLNYGWLVDAASLTEDAVALRRNAAHLLRRARAGDRAGEALGCRALARAAAQGRDFARAERYLAMASASATARSSAHEHAATALCRAEVDLLRGERHAARAHLDDACQAFQDMRMQWHLGKAEGLLAAA